MKRLGEFYNFLELLNLPEQSPILNGKSDIIDSE